MPSWRNITIGLIALVAAFFAMTTSIARVSQFKQPALAASMPVTNGFADSKLAERILAKATPKGATTTRDLELSRADVKRVTELSKKSYRSEPLNFAALRNLALIQDFKGNKPQARALMRDTVALTKRDASTNIWLITDYSELADLDSLTTTYDQALRTSGAARELLMPALLQGLGNDALVPFMVGLLQEKPNWGRQFWDTVFTVPEALENAAVIRIALSKDGYENTRRADQLLVESLTRKGFFEKGSELNAALSPQPESSQVVRNSEFDQPLGFAPYDWELFFDSFFSVDLDASSGSMRINTFADGSGLVARQNVALAGNSYTLEVVAADWDTLDTGALYARIYCAEVAAGKEDSARIIIDSANFKSAFIKPRSDCTYHWLDIYARSQPDQQDNVVVLKKVALVPTASR